MLMKIEPKKPVSKGMKVVKFAEFPLKNLVGNKQKNDVRFAQTDEGAVGKIMTLITNEKYEPHYHVPPTVEMKDEELGELVTGFHRYAAHVGKNKETMWVAIVEFEDFGGKSAAYWKSQWKLIENLEEENVKTPRTQEDIVGKIVNMIKVEKVMTSSEDDIVQALTDAKLSKGKIALYTSLIFSNLGQATKVVDAIDNEELKEYADNYADDNDVDTFTATFTDVKNKDYDKRAIFNYFDSVLNGSPATCVARINGANQEKVLLVREKKEMVIKEEIKKLVQVVKYAEENNIDLSENFILKFAPQLYREDDII